MRPTLPENTQRSRLQKREEVMDRFITQKELPAIHFSAWKLLRVTDRLMEEGLFLFVPRQFRQNHTVSGITTHPF